MLVTNKNLIQSRNEGFKALTYWCKLNTTIAHFPTLSIAEETAFATFIYHIILLSLLSITQLKMRLENWKTSVKMGIFSSLGRTNAQDGSLWVISPSPDPAHTQYKGKRRIPERQDNSRLRRELQLEINYTSHEGKPGRCSFVGTDHLTKKQQLPGFAPGMFSAEEIAV